MAPDAEQIESVTFVGAGDAALLTALALNAGFDDLEIRLIDEFADPAPEVGKSTLYAFVHILHNHLDIDPDRLFANVNMCWKTSIYFEDWCGQEFHSPVGFPFPIVKDDDREARDRERASLRATLGDDLAEDHEPGFHEFHYRYQKQNFETMYERVAETPGKTPLVIDERDVYATRKALTFASYQFQTADFNDFLREICRERGIELVDDRITDVTVDNDRIQAVHGTAGTYEADLYVDASGFSRVLMRELDNGFVEWDLPVDSAVRNEVDIELSEAQSATVCTSGEAGWFWQIDAWDVRDIGYVYSSQHLTESEAEQEFLATREEAVDPDTFEHHHWTPGRLERAWVGNCVAVGNAFGFPEPLNSLSLSTHTVLAEWLTTLLGKHARLNHDGIRAVYNDAAAEAFDEVYRFITIYYRHNQGTNDFWTEARELVPGDLPEYEAYQESGFAGWLEREVLTQDLPERALNSFQLYFRIYTVMGVESAFYETLDLEVDPDVARRIDEHTAELDDRIDEHLSYQEIAQLFMPEYGGTTGGGGASSTARHEQT